ncbi:hypothetical protein ACVNF4_35835, partial [Streptomyces sp. S6]
MGSPYRALFAAPGTKGFAAAGFVGRMPLSMMGIGVVTMISQLTGRYLHAVGPLGVPDADRAVDGEVGEVREDRRVTRRHRAL